MPAETRPQQQRQPLDIEKLARQAPPARDASREDKADYVVARFTVQDDHYRGLYRLWSKTLFFLAGKHWLKWNEEQGVYEGDTDVPPWRQQPVTNLTYAVFRTTVAKLLKQRPTTEVIPPSGDSDDRDTAALAEAILEFLWRHLKTPQKVARALGWFVTCGNVFFDVGWDANAGAVKPNTVLVEVPHTDPERAAMGETMDVDCPCDEQGEPRRRAPMGPEDMALDGGDPYDLDGEPDMVAEGEIDLDIDDPFSTRLNPDAESPEDAEEWFTAKLWPKQQIADTFKIPLSLLGDGDDTTALRAEFDDALSRANAAAPDTSLGLATNAGSTAQADAIGDRALVIAYYRKPCPEEGFPDGRHWITAGRVQVWPPEDDPDYPDGEAPVPFRFWPPKVPLIDTPLPGQAHGLGMLTQVVPLNEQLNYTDGKITEFHVTMAMGGVWFVHPADRDMVITSEPGQVKVSKGMEAGGQGSAPKQAQLQALPAAVYAEREVLKNKIQMVAGLSDIDMGQRPEGVSAGRAFLVLQEASDAAIMPSLMALEQAIEEIGRRELVVAQAKYATERTIRIRGEKGRWEFHSFKGSDLRDGLDVRVNVGSSFPWSKSAQWDTKLSVIQALPQLILKPDGTPDREQLGRYLDAGAPGLSTFDSDENPDLVEIDREHAMFEVYNPDEGRLELPQLGFWQTHPVHLKYHYEFLKRDYGRFMDWHPRAREAFLAHCQQTAAAVQQIANTMVPGAAPPPPAGGDPNAPPAPGEPAPDAPPEPSPGNGAGPMAGGMRLTAGDRAAAGV